MQYLAGMSGTQIEIDSIDMPGLKSIDVRRIIKEELEPKGFVCGSNDWVGATQAGIHHAQELIESSIFSKGDELTYLSDGMKYDKKGTASPEQIARYVFFLARSHDAKVDKNLVRTSGITNNNVTIRKWLGKWKENGYITEDGILTTDGIKLSKYVPLEKGTRRNIAISGRPKWGERMSAALSYAIEHDGKISIEIIQEAIPDYKYINASALLRSIEKNGYAKDGHIDIDKSNGYLKKLKSRHKKKAREPSQKRSRRFQDKAMVLYLLKDKPLTKKEILEAYPDMETTSLFNSMASKNFMKRNRGFYEITESGMELVESLTFRELRKYGIKITAPAPSAEAAEEPGPAVPRVARKRGDALRELVAYCKNTGEISVDMTILKKAFPDDDYNFRYQFFQRLKESGHLENGKLIKATLDEYSAGSLARARKPISVKRGSRFLDKLRILSQIESEGPISRSMAEESIPP